MKTQSVLKDVLTNQRGGMAALLSVVVLSMVIVTSLSSVYIYLENRARFQGRLKMSYQITYAMEEIARIASQGYDIASQSGDPTNPATITCPLGMVRTNQVATPSPLTLCVPPTNTNGGQGVCVTNQNISPNRICVTALTDINTETMIAKNSILENWYGKLDKFFDTTVISGTPAAQKLAWNFLETEFQPPTYLGWLLPQTAHAGDNWAEYHQLEEIKSDEGYLKQMSDAYDKYFPDRQEVAQATEPEAAAPVDDSNFLNLNPTYVAANLEVNKEEHPGTRAVGDYRANDTDNDEEIRTGISHCVVNDCAATVAITTLECEPNPDTGLFDQDVQVNGRSCFRCANGIVGSAPCFNMQLANPLNPASNYRMSVRLIR